MSELPPAHRLAVLEKHVRHPQSRPLLHQHGLHPDTVLEVADHCHDNPDADAENIAATLSLTPQTATRALRYLTEIGHLGQ